MRSAFARVTATIPGVSGHRDTQATYHTIEPAWVRNEAESVTEVRLYVVPATSDGRNYYNFALLFDQDEQPCERNLPLSYLSLIFLDAGDFDSTHCAVG